MDSKGFSIGYRNSSLFALDKLFNFEIKTIEKVIELVKSEKVPKKATTVGIRVLLNFYEEQRILSEDCISYLRKHIKIVRKAGPVVDVYVPSIKEVRDSLNTILEKYSIEHQILYKLMIETGMRYTELINLIKNFNEKNVEIIKDEDICVYSNFFLRGYKKSFYLFFTLQTYKLLIKYLNTLKEINFSCFSKSISKQGNICNMKYLRKFQFNLLIEQGVSIEVANFIQGRSSVDVGVNFYLAKKKSAVTGYKSIIKVLEII